VVHHEVRSRVRLVIFLTRLDPCVDRVHEPHHGLLCVRVVAGDRKSGAARFFEQVRIDKQVRASWV
jgi:hypothetical protein